MLKLALRNPITGAPRARGRLQRKPIAAANSILDPANPKPGKVEVWVVRGGEIAERGARRPDALSVEARA